MNPLRYNIEFSISVDPDANFLEVDNRTALSVIYDLIESAIYEIDDVKINDLRVQED